MNNSEIITTLLVSLLSSAVLASVIKNIQDQATKHRELVAAASKSVFKRVEMCYRIRRRTKNTSDIIKIRDMFHQIQEENEYYRVLLTIESKWHGGRYTLYIQAVKELTEQQIQEAWEQQSFGPNTEIEPENKPNHAQIDKLSTQFAKDSRRLMNPLMRSWMRLRDSWLVTRIWRITVYDL
ncbi:hypothetical protein [uncultured Campylobacter sp.]|uniref:hypothetical protein n=1 Tax=uncultured Campylobacter sp. TaxID=218934 RepID=UPI002626CF6F|nr:hypothetical protein [uncultured Campylobacter sp.]